MKKLFFLFAFVLLLPVVGKAATGAEVFTSGPFIGLPTSIDQKLVFFSSPDQACTVVCPNCQKNPWQLPTPVGKGACQTKTGSSCGYSFPSTVGKALPITAPHTGDDSGYCNWKGEEVPKLTCGTKYGWDGQVKEGTYCDNAGNAEGTEKDNVCRSGSSSWNYRQDTGWEKISVNLDSKYVVEITEPDLEGWLNNDPFDPDGSKANFQGFAVKKQTENNLILDSYLQKKDGEIPEQTWQKLAEIKAKYLDQGDPVLMGIYFSRFGFTLGGHALILTRAEINGNSATLTVADSNFANGKTTIKCEKNLLSSRFHCQSDSYNSKLGKKITIKVIDWNFNEKLTAELRTSAQRYCDQNAGRGNLCARQGQFNKWVEDNITLFGKNFMSNTKLGNDGDCLGWSDTVLRVAYLANFVGENPVIKVTSCASDLAGEDKTFYCQNNQSACKISLKTELQMPDGEKVVTTEAAGGVCSFKNAGGKAPYLPGNILSTGFHLESFSPFKCDGKEHLLAFQAPGWRVTYIPQANSIAAKKSGAAFAAKIKSLIRSYSRSVNHLPVALVNWISGPSCVFSVGSGDWATNFTFHNDLLYVRPAARPLSSGGSSELMQSATKLWSSEFVYVPDSDYVWQLQNNSFVQTKVDRYSAIYFSELLKWMARQGITTSCHLTEPLPARFQQFLRDMGASDIPVPPAAQVTISVVGAGSVRFGTTTIASTSPLSVPAGTALPLTATYFGRRYPAPELLASGQPRRSYGGEIVWPAGTCAPLSWSCPTVGSEVICAATSTTCQIAATTTASLVIKFQEAAIIRPGTAARLPDLEAKPLFSNRRNNEVKAGEGITVSGGLRNPGGPAQNVKIAWFLDGTSLPKNQGILPLVKATSTWLTGLSANRLTDIYLPPASLKAGAHTLTLKLDPDNALKEDKEDNNFASLNFTVLAPAVPAPVISAFTATPADDGAHLSWTVTGADTCYLLLPPKMPTSVPLTATGYVLSWTQTSLSVTLSCQQGAVTAERNLTVTQTAASKVESPAPAPAPSAPASLGPLELSAITANQPASFPYGSAISFSAPLRNTGTTNAEHIRIDWYADSRLVKTATDFSLPPSKTPLDLSATRLALPKPLPGNHTVKMFVTYGGERAVVEYRYTVTGTVSFFSQLLSAAGLGW